MTGFARTRYNGVRGFAPPTANIYDLKSNILLTKLIVENQSQKGAFS